MELGRCDRSLLHFIPSRRTTTNNKNRKWMEHKQMIGVGTNADSERVGAKEYYMTKKERTDPFLQLLLIPTLLMSMAAMISSAVQASKEFPSD